MFYMISVKERYALAAIKNMAGNYDTDSDKAPGL